jgi:hypothetical protein
VIVAHRADIILPATPIPKKRAAGKHRRSSTTGVMRASFFALAKPQYLINLRVSAEMAPAG